MAMRDQAGIADQVRQWMTENKKENSRLEFKLLIDLTTVGSKAEFVRDVISLANSEGESPRADGLLVIGYRNGKYQDVAPAHYDGAPIGEIVDANVYPPLWVHYEEFSNRKRGRAGVLIVKPDPDVVYVVRKKVHDGNGRTELLPGQAWGRKSGRKVELSGDDLHKRNCDIQERKVDRATAELQHRIERLQAESGAALEVKRVRYKMEATGDWRQLEALIPELLPYAREYDFKIKNEVLDALSTATGRASQGMTVGVAGEVDFVLGELMPVGTGGAHHPSRTPISNDEQALLERIGYLTFEMTWNACRYLRNMEIVDVGAQRFWYLIRFATLNGLRHAQPQLLRHARSCRDICNEERNCEPFVEAGEKLDEEIEDALDAFSFDYTVSTVNAGGLTTKIVSECVAIIKTGEAVDWRSAKRELPLASRVVVAYQGSQIAGVGAIKCERRDYAADISKKSGFMFPAETPELGYVAVAPEHQGRGLSFRIAKLLASHTGPLFATTYEERMMKTLTRVGFFKKGKEWRGRQHMLSLWFRE
jgi:GNAT superfamily N-acetyltransferase